MGPSTAPLNTMTTETIAILGLIVFGLVFGTLTARSSIKREPITASNGLAKASHYLAASILCTVTPTVLVSIFVLHLGFIGAVSIAVVMFAIAFVLLMPYAILERPALDEKAKRQDQGWTKEDALSSGL